MHHLIFEGAELAGKSWIMSQVYNHLEPKYNSNQGLLDGCHWFNCDVGVFGSEHGRRVIGQYLGTVRPMHIAFVEPSRKYADIIIPEGHNPVSTAMVVTMIRQRLRGGSRDEAAAGPEKIP